MKLTFKINILITCSTDINIPGKFNKFNIYLICLSKLDCPLIFLKSVLSIFFKNCVWIKHTHIIKYVNK